MVETVLITPEGMLMQRGRYVKMLQEAGFEVQYPRNPQLCRGVCDQQETIDELRPCQAVIAGGEGLSSEVLAALPELRVIARAGVGFDQVDVDAATSRGIVVTITPTANHEAVAEQALALLFAVAKSVVTNDRRTRAGDWSRKLTEPIRGSTFGVFGLGRIGRSTAVRAAALGMHVIATEVQPDQEFIQRHGIELVDFDTLLARSDYLSIHCPLNDATRGMFDKRVFSRMKKGSVLINTARGNLVVEADLVEALRHGPLRAAGLDVFQQEPTPTDNPLLRLDQVVVSPHTAGVDHKSQEDMGIEAADCIIKLSRGQWPDGAVVNDQLRGSWKW